MPAPLVATPSSHQSIWWQRRPTSNPSNCVFLFFCVCLCLCCSACILTHCLPLHKKIIIKSSNITQLRAVCVCRQFTNNFRLFCFIVLCSKLKIDGFESALCSWMASGWSCPSYEHAGCSQQSTTQTATNPVPSSLYDPTSGPGRPRIGPYLHNNYRRAERAPHLSYSGEKSSSYIYICFLYIYIYTFVRRARARYAQTSDRPVEVQRSI